MAVALGGRVAEELIFGPDNVTTGASGDFQQVRRRGGGGSGGAVQRALPSGPPSAPCQS